MWHFSLLECKYFSLLWKGPVIAMGCVGIHNFLKDQDLRKTNDGKEKDHEHVILQN